jgi:hypothetical protein
MGHIFVVRSFYCDMLQFTFSRRPGPVALKGLCIARGRVNLIIVGS